MGLAAALTLPAQRAAALDPSIAVTQYVKTVWRAPQTLPHDDVSAVLQTRDGYLWVGTVEGLARFDGVRSVVFSKANAPAFTNNWIRCILEDRNGRLWIGTYGGGLVCRDGERFARCGTALGLTSDIVFALLEERDGRILAATPGGVFGWSGGQFAREPGTEAVGGTVRALLRDRTGSLWIGASDGLYRLRDGRLDRLTTADGLTDDTVMCLAEDEGSLWIGTERGGVVRRTHDGRISAITPAEGLAHERIWSLATDRDGNVWIGTDGGGLQRLHDGRLSLWSTRNGFDGDFIWAIREDREGGLWVATNGGGLIRLKNPRALTFTTREGLPSDFVWSLRRTGDGGLWVGTEDAGLARIDGDQVRVLTVRDGLPSNHVKALLDRPDGSLWLGGGAGLARVRDGRVERLEIAGLPRDRVAALVEDAEGSVWVGHGSQLSRMQGERVTASFPAADVSDILVARDGTVWAAFLGGLMRIRSGSPEVYTAAQGLVNEAVTALFEAPDGSVWAATRGGLVRARGGRLTTITSRQGLEDDAIVSALLDDQGQVWLGSNRGLARVALRELEDVLAGKLARVTCATLGLDDGLKSVEVNMAHSARWKDPDGHLWFATRGGLVTVDPAQLKPVRRPLAVAIEEVLADEKPLSPWGGWMLPPGTRRLEIRYTAFSFLSPERIRFRRRLEDFDDTWVDAGTRRTVEYTNLEHGSYTFRVSAASADGPWPDTGATLAFTVAPRLQEETWVRVLVVLFFAVVGPFFYLSRTQRLERQKADLERLVESRTSELATANERLAQLSREDPLTGLANRRRLDQALADEWRRAHRMRAPLSLLLLDVDQFKSYNDHLGHLAGDACLKAVAAAVADAHTRSGELVARYGGEEFAVLIPGADLQAALASAEHVRRRIEELALPHPRSQVSEVVTVSVGAACLQPSDGGAPPDLVAAADRALYAAKERGRNRVEATPD